MNKRYLYATIVLSLAATVTSCTSDDQIEDSSLAKTSEEITYTVSANNLTRAENVFHSLNLPEQFHISAWESEKNSESTPYFSRDMMVRDGAGNWINTLVKRCWPKSGKLDFIAYVGDEDTFNGNRTEPAFERYRIKSNSFEQLDLMYASATRKSKTDGAVNLVFHHALSQIEFRTIVSAAPLEVKINSITIVNLHSEGTFRIEGESGNWTQTDMPTTTYTIDNTDAPVVKYDSTTRTGQLVGNDKEGSLDVLTLLPQTRRCWIPGERNDGVYLKVDCNIYSNPTGEEDNQVTIHSGYTYIPIDVDWRPGTKYTYTLNFGNGPGGYKSLDNASPTLTYIALTCSVDDFSASAE